MVDARTVHTARRTGMVMLSERRRRVLQALIEEYTATGVPVGSKSLVERYRLECSPATVRSELAALEETGYLQQPHVSAGRIPTDQGYREFVDELLQEADALRALEAEEIRTRYLEVAGELDDLMRQTSAMLSHLTHYVAVVLAPAIGLARIKRVSLVPVTPERGVLVLITESGQVVDRSIELPRDTSAERLAAVERTLNAALAGRQAAELRQLKDAFAATGELDSVAPQVVGELIACLEEADRDRLYHVGVPELLALPEFAEAQRVRPLIGLLEDGLAMLDTLSEAMQVRGITVRIGSENRRRELDSMSLVATRYGAGDADGIVGVIGPTRMNYPRTIAAVKCAADGLSEALG